MKANAAPVLAVFEKKLRLEVPLFQRQYVWSREQQWQPLWEDIARKFSEYLEGRKDAPVHFLGAMVLDQKQTPTTHVEKRQVVDGQQRLTTLQIFLSAFRDFCRENECVDLADESDSFTVNKGMMANAELDRFKVWPTQLDRSQFSDVILSHSRKELETRHPIVRRKYARSPEPRPRMVEAYLFFHDQLQAFFLGTEADRPLKGDLPLATRLEESFQALRAALQVVVIDLEQDDDAQVIFETLNARGEPLLPVDLLRNYIFLRAAREKDNQEDLYDRYWRRFDEPFWREEVRQGRLSRPRSDLYMQYFLSSRQCIDIPIKHLFVEYKFWIRTHPFPTVTAEIETLARQGDDYRTIIAPTDKSDPFYDLATFLTAFETRTVDPFLLFLRDVKVPDDQLRTIATLLESYLLRRAICGLTTSNYTRVFLALTRAARTDGPTVATVMRHLGGLGGETTGWPTDDVFREAFVSGPAYERLQNARLVHVFTRLSATYMTNKSEDITFNGGLSVEHILPQKWRDRWPLKDGSSGMSVEQLQDADPTSSLVQLTVARDMALHRLGNLTILTQPLNSSLSNGPWIEKKPALLSASLLPINQQLVGATVWDEETIGERANALFDRALKLWPRPTSL